MTLDKLIKLENEAKEFGFYWEDSQQIMAQIQSECHEVQVHLVDNDKKKLQEEIGDLLHAVYSLCVFCHLNPEDTLQKSVDKFEKRFVSVKQLAHQQGLTTLTGQSFDTLMALWNQAKVLLP